MLTHEQVALADRLAESIKPLLAGHPPEVQGATLADLLSLWLAGHFLEGSPAETTALREELLALHIATVRDLVPVNEAMFLSRPGRNRT